MTRESIILVILVLFVLAISSHGSYYSNSEYVPIQEKKTELHFFLHDTMSGTKPSAVLVAQTDRLPPAGLNNPVPFGSFFAIDDLLTEGPELTSQVIGNARGAYISSSQGKDTTLTMMVDFGFTTGKFNGSSVSVMSRNPISETSRELAVVGGRGKFRMARGFAKLKTQFVNFTSGDAVVEYHVTLLHY